MNRQFLKRRRGAALLVALVALAIVGGIAASMLRTAALSREHLRMAEHGRQAAWLLESGMNRAQARLAGAEDYQGETWQPELATAGRSASVTIRIEELPEQPAHLRIRVVARHEAAGRLVQRSREMVVMPTLLGAQP